MAIGTDSQVRIDPFEELREMETLARREGQTRDALVAAAGGDLWAAVARAGRESLGLDPDRGGGEIEINLDHPELVGIAAEDLPRALATCASAAIVVPRS
jgi:formimidoylglutamate deiminase